MECKRRLQKKITFMHSHKKRIVWKAAQAAHFKKNMAFPEGNKLFAGDFRANLDQTNADMVQFTKRWNWKWIV